MRSLKQEETIINNNYNYNFFININFIMKRFTLLKTMLLLCALIVGSGSACGADVTITFASPVTCSSGVLDKYANDGGNITLTTAQNSSSSVTAISGSQLRLYSENPGGNGCSVTITSATKWIQTVVFTFSDKTNAAASQGKYTYTSGTTGTWSGGGHNAKTVTLQNTNKSSTQVRITKIEITYGDAPAVINPVFSANPGYIVKGSAVELSTETAGADIYYTTNGSTPTASSTPYTGAITVDNEMTIKAIAIKGGDKSEVVEASYKVYTPVPGLSIDFEESAIVAYSDWEFVNIGIHDSGITAHGGSAWGSNVNANGNGTATCSITTKAKIAHPETFTCYISKESGNTSTSSWKIQTSTDGSSWTDVATKDAKGMSKGEWQEFSADLSTYTNVFVRLYYGSNTAVRAVDDIVLTEAAVDITPANAKSTYVTSQALDFTEVKDLKAYVATGKGDGKVVMTKVNTVPTGTPLMLVGTASTKYTIPVAASAEAPETNYLKAGPYTFNGTETDKYFLSTDGDFHLASAGTLAAGKAYLDLEGVSASRVLSISFNDDETTGIEAVNVNTESNHAAREYYNLNGQRVANPTKGLYIVNGKKVIIK